MAEQEEFDIRGLYQLEKYLSVLVDCYPEPVRAARLAEKTGYTKAAVSKIRERLVEICDRNPMIFEKGFVLSTKSNVLFSVFVVFLAHGNHKKFLKSRFFRAIIDGKRIHSKIISQFPIYEERFSVEDTTFFVKKIIESVERLPPKDFKFLVKIFSARKNEKLLFYQHMDNIRSIMNKLHFSLDNKNEVSRIISIRDKFFFLIRDFLWTKIVDMEILKKQDSKTRTAYEKVYKDTVDFYLRRTFKGFDESLLKSAKKFYPKDFKDRIEIGASHFIDQYYNE